MFKFGLSELTLCLLEGVSGRLLERKGVSGRLGEDLALEGIGLLGGAGVAFGGAIGLLGGAKGDFWGVTGLLALSLYTSEAVRFG